MPAPSLIASFSGRKRNHAAWSNSPLPCRGTTLSSATAASAAKPDNDWEADIGYELDPRQWGKGYATEAAQALVDYGFKELGLFRLSSWCIADNTPSVRVLERLGFRQEGRLRRNEFFKGRWWDTLLYALLRDEWESLQRG